MILFIIEVLKPIDRLSKRLNYKEGSINIT